MSDSLKESGPVGKPVAGLTGVAGHGGVGSGDHTPHGNGSPPWTSGQATIGRVTASEARVDASSALATETRDDTVGLSHKGTGVW